MRKLDDSKPSQLFFNIFQKLSWWDKQLNHILIYLLLHSKISWNGFIKQSNKSWKLGLFEFEEKLPGCVRNISEWIWVLYILHEAHNSEKPQMGNSMELWNSRLGSICSTNQLLSTSYSLSTYRNTKHNCLKISYLSWMGKVFRNLQNPLWNWPSLHLYINT